MDTTDITIPVPSDRVAEFYQLVGAWMETPRGGPAAAGAAADETASDIPLSEQDLSAAVTWWKSLKPREREIFGLWVDASPKMLSAKVIVETMKLKGPRDIPGILSWPSRKGTKAGFRVHWNFRYDAVSEEPIYGIEDVAYAKLLDQARTEAENA